MVGLGGRLGRGIGRPGEESGVCVWVGLGEE